MPKRREILEDINEIIKKTYPGKDMIPALIRRDITFRFDDQKAEVWACRNGVEIMLDPLVGAIFALERSLTRSPEPQPKR